MNCYEYKRLLPRSLILMFLLNMYSCIVGFSFIKLHCSYWYLLLYLSMHVHTHLWQIMLHCSTLAFSQKCLFIRKMNQPLQSFFYSCAGNFQKVRKSLIIIANNSNRELVLKCLLYLIFLVDFNILIMKITGYQIFTSKS